MWESKQEVLSRINHCIIRLLIIPFSFSARNEKTEAQLYTSALLIPGLYFSRMDSISDIGIVLFSAKDAEFVLEFVLTFWNTQVVLQKMSYFDQFCRAYQMFSSMRNGITPT